MKKYLNLITMLLILFLIFYFLNRSINLREGYRNSLVYVGHRNCIPFCSWQNKRKNKFLENDFGSHSIYETGLIKMPSTKFRNKRYSGVFKDSYQGAFENSYPGYYN